MPHEPAPAEDANDAARLSPVPALLVIGSSTSRERAIGALLRARPLAEPWAVIDTAAGIGAGAAEESGCAGVERVRLGGGCVCCTGLLVFRVGLARYLRQRRRRPPARLLIDCALTEHLARVRAELSRPECAALLRLDATLACTDAADLAPAASPALAAACREADFVLVPPPGAGGEGAMRLAIDAGAPRTRLHDDAAAILAALRASGSRCGAPGA